MNKEDYKAIVERCEQVRTALGMNKSRFSAAIGMKPQTYNNFIGHQGSKPNVDLVRGIVAEFGVSAEWLLFGTGEMFRTVFNAPASPQHYQHHPWPESAKQIPWSTGHLTDAVQKLKSDMEVVKRFMGESSDAIRRRLVEEAGGGVQHGGNSQEQEPPHA